ncbi:adenylosuccinate synthase [Lachnospiraceae bacterium NE2001]|nr:adenylosuccinate synthase [Lachnospiraceae bacterium NE2001]
MKDVKIVIGASFGDEGKGLMTDYFAGEAIGRGEKCLVVCSNGGAQRGHTVRVSSEVRHVFHHFGSGSLAGADTYLPYFFILNPMMFVNEYYELTGEMNTLYGRKAEPRVYVHPECPVSTPFDMIANQILEEYRGAGRHGSCGMGIWETLVRSGKQYGELIRMNDDELFDYLSNECRSYLWKRLEEKKVDRYRDEWKEIIEDDGLIQHYIEDFRTMQNMVELADVELFGDYDRVIFENGQGLLLDRCRREFGNNTTPSNTGVRNPFELLREYNSFTIRNKNQIKAVKPDECEKHMGDLSDNKDRISVEVCYVTRTYLTRHGAGRFEEECDKSEINPDMVDLTNVPNPHQGTIRYGKLSSRSLLRRIREDYDSDKLPQCYETRRTLAVTHLNEYVCDIVKEADYISDGETRETVNMTKNSNKKIINIINKDIENRQNENVEKIDATYYLNYNKKRA